MAFVDFAPHNMTSNTLPAPYVASASQESSSSFRAFKAFDNGVGGGQYWVTLNASTGWIKIDVSTARKLDNYSLKANVMGEPNRQPRNWTMQGSNDNTNWDILDTVTDQISWTTGQTRNFDCDTKGTAYRYFKIVVTQNNGDALLSIGEIYLYRYMIEETLAESVTVTDSFSPIHQVDSVIEDVTVSDQFIGEASQGISAEQITITDVITGFDYHGKQAETVTITDSMGRAIEATRAVEETITFSDEMEPLHLVDANTEAVTLGDSFVADEMIRKKTRHPRLQGKHLSLKFSSSAHGSFAVYYLRAKVHKTIAVERRPLHPNLQGRHLSLKISHNAAAEFKAYYASAKMAATRGLSNSVHPNAQGSHIGLTLKHTAAEAFRMDYASMRLMQVKR